MLVRSRMTPEVIAASPETTIAEALSITRSKRIRHLPVLDGDRLVGVVTDRDLRLAMPPIWGEQQEELQEALNTRHVREVMVTNMITVPPDMPVEHAAKLLYTHRIGCLPVLDGDRLVGILTETDVLRAFAELFGATEPSTRIEVQMSNRPGELARVVRLIGIEHRINIVGLVVPPMPGGEQSVAIIHLAVEEVGPMVTALRKRGYRVGRPSLESDPEVDMVPQEDYQLPHADPARVTALAEL
jgi:acetoin utilization protein AcuB